MEGLQFGAEQKGIVRPSIVKRLDPQAIANQCESVFLRIPECEAEHPVEPMQSTFCTPESARLQ